MRTRPFALALVLVVLAGCDSGPPPEPLTAFGLYDIDGAATCNVMPDGVPAEVFTITGEVEVSEPPAGHPAECERILDLRITTCVGCFPSPCSMCLTDVTDVEGVMSATLIADPTLMGVRSACQLQDSEGVMTTRLFVEGRMVAGSASTAADRNGTIQLNLTGTTARGISGANRPSTVSCAIDMNRRPDPVAMP